MTKIKSLMLAIAAIVASISFTSCSNDSENTKNNIEEFQPIVDQMVTSQKQHDKVILLVAFGSTWQQAFDTFDAVQEAYEKEFPSYDIFLSFSSAICINNAHAWEHKDDGAEQRDYYGPEYWLTAIGKCGYKEIIVQSLQVTPGEEFRLVRDKAVKDFMNNKYRAFTNEYMKSIDRMVQVGTPLLAEEEDVENLANVLVEESDIKSVIDGGGVVAFMGHGNPVGYDYGGANIRYNQLETALQNITGATKYNFFVGTVDDEDNLVGDVLQRMEVVTKGTKVQLYPLMSIAGDHAHNDLADPEDALSWFNLMNMSEFDASAEETNFNEAKYKKYVKGEGYIPGLAERSKVLQLWINHTKAAIKSIADGDGLSTPTTEPDEE